MTRNATRLSDMGELDWRSETRFPVNETGHTVFLSYAGHGKTTSAMKWVQCAAFDQPDRQFLILDSETNWHCIGGRFRRGEFERYTIGDANHPLQLNLCKIPMSWTAEAYAEWFAGVFAHVYGLDGSDERLFSTVLKTMYELHGADQDPDKSSAVTLASVHRFMLTMLRRAESTGEVPPSAEQRQIKRLLSHLHRFSTGERDHASFGRNHRHGVDYLCRLDRKNRVTLIDSHRANPQTRQLVFALIAMVQLQAVRLNPTEYSEQPKTLVVDSKDILFDHGPLDGQLKASHAKDVQVVYTASRVSALSARTINQVRTVFVGRLYNDDYRKFVSLFQTGSTDDYTDRVMWLRDGEFLCLRKRRSACKVSFLPPR